MVVSRCKILYDDEICLSMEHVAVCGGGTGEVDDRRDHLSLEFFKLSD